MRKFFRPIGSGPGPYGSGSSSSQDSYKKPSYSRKGKKRGKLPRVLCIIISVFTILTLIIGLGLKNPYWLIAGIIPAALYEAWRTEGFYTKAASLSIVVLVVLEVLAILGKIKINLATVLEQEEAYFAGYYIPLGDIKFVFPAAMVILSLILLWRTYGKYTKWLSVLLTASSVALLYLVNKKMLIEIIKNFI